MSTLAQPSNYRGRIVNDPREQRRRDPTMGDLPRIPRDEFIGDFWDYKPGEHVTFLAPTQAGKTTLAFDLLGVTATKNLPVTVLVMKPRDSVVRGFVDRYKKSHDWKEVKQWPPMIRGKHAGYVLWPRFQFDPKKDNPKQKGMFRKAILDTYGKGNGIVFGDELYGLVQELELDDELIALWSRGAGMGAGLWGASQKPSHIPLWAYSQVEHLFLSHDPDKRARLRYDEIGGINPRVVESHVMQLQKHEWLYIRRTGPEAAIIQAE